MSESAPSMQRRTPLWARLAAAYVLAAMAVLLGVSVFYGDWNAGQSPFPFVWRDVAVVYLACAFPLAAVVTPVFRRTIPPAPLIVVAAIIYALGILPDVTQRRFASDFRFRRSAERFCAYVAFCFCWRRRC